MSLKGYEWLSENNDVIMSYFFKDERLILWKDVTQEELDKFVAYLKEHGNTYYHLDTNSYKVIVNEK